jgi:hypothetical protein
MYDQWEEQAFYFIGGRSGRFIAILLEIFPGYGCLMSSDFRVHQPRCRMFGDPKDLTPSILVALLAITWPQEVSVCQVEFYDEVEPKVSGADFGHPSIDGSEKEGGLCTMYEMRATSARSKNQSAVLVFACP